MAKPLGLLILLALALSALSVPSSASAVEWREEGKPLKENATISLAGKLTTEFTELEGGAITCGVKGSMVLEAGKSTASFTSLEGTGGCTGSGALAECPSWTGSFTWHKPSVDINIFPPFLSGTGGLEIDFFEASCSTPKTTAVYPSFTLEPDKTVAISSLAMAASGSTEKENVGKVKLAGSLSVTPAKKYGFE